MMPWDKLIFQEKIEDKRSETIYNWDSFDDEQFHDLSGVQKWDF